MCTVSFDDGIDVTLAGGIEATIKDVELDLDDDGDVDAIRAGGVDLSRYSTLPEHRALWLALCPALDEAWVKNKCEDAYREWLADEPSRRADFRRDRAA